MSANGGFTLLELILVTVIIGILAGMVTLQLVGRQKEAAIQAAKGDISTFETAVDLFALDHNDNYPRSLQELSPKYIKRLNTDPWQAAYQYVQPGKHNRGSYDVFSTGPDGQPGTEDDVTNWQVD
jgi:general secretion pathway protein G